MTDTPAPRGETSPAYQAPPAQGPPAQARRQNGMGTTALVIGVVALVLAVLLVFAPIGALLGLIATVLGILGIARANQGLADNRGQALAGLLTGLVALVLGIAITIGVGTFLASHVTDLNRFGDCMGNAASSQARDTCAREFADRLGN